MQAMRGLYTAERFREIQLELWDKLNINPNTSVVLEHWWEAPDAPDTVPDGPIQVSTRGENKPERGNSGEESLDELLSYTQAKSIHVML